MKKIPQLTPRALKQRLDAGEKPFLLDVREPHEYQIANLGGTLIPMNEIPLRIEEIPRDQPVVVHCKAGMRSQRVAEFLAEAGYTQIENLAGGILAWSSEVDASVPTY